MILSKVETVYQIKIKYRIVPKRYFRWKRVDKENTITWKAKENIKVINVKWCKVIENNIWKTVYQDKIRNIISTAYCNLMIVDCACS